MKPTDKRKQRNWAWRGHGEISGAYWSGVKHNAKKRGLLVSITIEQAWDIFLSQNRKCALSGVDLNFVQNWSNKEYDQTASLDRIDNSLGYVVGNVRWVHKKLNSMRIRLNDDEFIKWCKLVTNYQDKPTHLEASRNLIKQP